MRKDEIHRVTPMRLEIMYDEILKIKSEKPIIAEQRINRALSAAFEEVPKLKFILMRGWTPGFNDGEVCLHKQDIVIVDFVTLTLNGENTLSEDDEKLLSRKPLYVSDTRWNSESACETEHDKHVPDDSYIRQLVTVGRILRHLSDEFNMIYGTNWELRIIRSDNSVDGYFIERSEYDCGY